MSSNLDRWTPSNGGTWHHRPKYRLIAGLAGVSVLAVAVAALAGLTAGGDKGANAAGTITAPTAGTPVCGVASILTGPSTAPAGAITVTAPASIQAAVDANPAGATFYLKGVFNNAGTITPKDGNSFIGAPGATLDGGGSTQFAFKAGNPWPNIADDVTIKYLTIQHFNAPDDQFTVNQDAGDGWTLANSTITLNHGGGMGLGSRGTIQDSCLKDNGQYGFSAFRCRAWGSGGCMTSTTITDLKLIGNEIRHNDTEDLAINRPGCGCSGGGKFWDVRGAQILNNWVVGNNSVGLWADTNDMDFLIQGNVIEDNFGPGLFYEISYNMRVIGNTFRKNTIGQGARRTDSFPDGAIYISESGGDSAAEAAARARGESWTRVNANQNILEIADNVFENNWNSIILWESSDRYCGSVANTSTGYCTLYFESHDSAKNGANMSSCQPQPASGMLDKCRWKTQNVSVHNNTFTMDPNVVGNGCTASNLKCGRNAIFSQWGSIAPYTGDAVSRKILFAQNNVFSQNTYRGTWHFTAFDQGMSSIRDWATWSAPAPANAVTAYSLWASPANGLGQDAGSTLDGSAPTPLPAPTPTTAPATTAATTAPATTAPATTAPVTTAPATTVVATTAPATTTATTVAPAPTTVRYEAESASSGGGARKSTTGTGFSGTGYVSNMVKGSYVSWGRVNAPAAGQATLAIKAMAPSNSAGGTLRLTVNGKTVQSALKVPASGTSATATDWANGVTVTATVNLRAGSNTIRLDRTTNSGSIVQVDFVDLTPPAAAPAPAPTVATTAAPATTAAAAPVTTLSNTASAGSTGTVKLEAEAGQLNAADAVTYGAGFSGTGWVTHMNSGSSITWSGVQGAGRTATITAHVTAPFSSSNESLAVFVDGTNVGTLSVPPTVRPNGDWTNWSNAVDVSVQVNLPAGAHTVMVQRPSAAGSGANVDYITVAA